MKNFRLILLFALLSAPFLKAQDKLVFKDGKKVNCKIAAISPHTITYRDSASGDNLITVPKNDVLMAEYKSGSIYIFGSDEAPRTSSVTALPVGSTMSERKRAWKEREAGFKDNIIGVQIPDLIFGRLTGTYERLFMDKQLGVVIPLSLTYNPIALLSSGITDTSSAKKTIRRGVNFATGVDVNFYLETRGRTKFFVGPRIRYGTDMAIGATGYSLQFQNGFFFPSYSGKMASTLSIGFGFVRVLAVQGTGVNSHQSYPWMSFTYRLGFRL